ncbi:MAG: hypothetical protein LBQ00_05940 [Syntrophobacterales bacterium]|jgi:hypothetical protein|nr:hypothetical protein [Syntrophobacterales bacterium]
MEIKIRRTGDQVVNGDPGALDVTNTYRVTEGGREFHITFRSHRYGASLGMAGKDGVLYTDKDENSVHRHVLAVGRGCGIGVESDELVEGLSPMAVRGVILAGQRNVTGEITLEQSEDGTRILIDGLITDLDQYL